LRLRRFRWGRGLRELDLEVAAGEVLAIAGLPGSDAEIMLRAIVGALPYSGSVTAQARVLPRTVYGAISAGRMGLIPADRKADGLFLDFSVTANIGVASLKRWSRWGFVQDPALSALAKEMVDRLHIQPADVTRPTRTLSGGNQQKTLVARWLSTGIRVLLAEEPTRGVDVATKRQIHDLLRDLADQGRACVVYSSDLQELVEIADRILVLRRDGSVASAPPRTSADRLFEMMSEAKAA
jgi:ribose transport system ATP-binding protein